MKKLPIFIAMAGAMMLALGACGSKKAPEAEETATVEAEETAQQEPVVAVVYNSPVAAGKPAFADDPSRQGPIALQEGRKRNSSWNDTVGMGDFGAFTMNGQRLVHVNILNLGKEMLTVDSILVPDSRFEVMWIMDRKELPSKSSTAIALYGDNIEAVSDYKLVIVYRNDSIPPQTLHFNIHPDIYKLHADYAASQQQQQ